MAKKQGWWSQFRGKILSEVTDHFFDAPMIKTVRAFANKASDAVDSFNHYVPTMEIMGGSVCDNIAFFTKFTAVASAAGIGIGLISVYQGFEAMKLIGTRLKKIGDEIRVLSTLNAMEIVPQQIHDFITEGLNTKFNDRKSHWFFVYHPDTFWTPRFCKITREHKLGPRFVGYTNQLDALFIFLLATRQELAREEKRARKERRRLRPVKFHIIIPVHQLTVFTEPLMFPEEVGDFVVEGKTYGNDELVWLNVPRRQERFLSGIGNWVPPDPSTWDEIGNWFGWCELPGQGEPRVLGFLPEYDSGSDEDDPRSSTDRENSESEPSASDHEPPTAANLDMPQKKRRVQQRSKSTASPGKGSRSDRGHGEWRRRRY